MAHTFAKPDKNYTLEKILIYTFYPCAKLIYVIR